MVPTKPGQAAAMGPQLSCGGRAPETVAIMSVVELGVAQGAEVHCVIQPG